MNLTPVDVLKTSNSNTERESTWSQRGKCWSCHQTLNLSHWKPNRSSTWEPTPPREAELLPTCQAVASQVINPQQHACSRNSPCKLLCTLRLCAHVSTSSISHARTRSTQAPAPHPDTHTPHVCQTKHGNFKSTSNVIAKGIKAKHHLTRGSGCHQRSCSSLWLDGLDFLSGILARTTRELRLASRSSAGAWSRSKISSRKDKTS